MTIPIKTRNRVVDQRFNRGPAGWSLTEPVGKWKWENPPKFVVPGEAVDDIISRIEGSEGATEQFKKLLFAGISIEEIVNTVAIGGFMEGQFTPDVAEIIKAPLAIYFLGMAAENNIPARMFNTADGNHSEDMGMSDEDMEDMMKENNPSLYRFLEQKAMEQEETPMQEPTEGGFLAVATITNKEEE
tara:strand:- start:123 stop:683 length:561 start_codon:yes stop_codon:yes gene_type:complete